VKSRSVIASSIAEIPLALFLIFIGLMFPLIALSTITYQAIILQVAVRDSCRAASRSSTWTLAKVNSMAVFDRDIHAFHGIKAEATPVIVIRAPDNSEKVTGDKLSLGSIEETEALYLVRISARAELTPIFAGGNWQGLKIPGFTAPMILSASDQIVSENPESLMN
jgi:hypothetical protein